MGQCKNTLTSRFWPIDKVSRPSPWSAHSPDKASACKTIIFFFSEQSTCEWRGSASHEESGPVKLTLKKTFKSMLKKQI